MIIKIVPEFIVKTIIFTNIMVNTLRFNSLLSMIAQFENFKNKLLSEETLLKHFYGLFLVFLIYKKVDRYFIVGYVIVVEASKLTSEN